MSKRIVLRQLAEQDVLEASFWYEAKSPTLRKDFLAEFEQLLFKLEKHSRRFSCCYYNNFRRIMMPRFPYKYLPNRKSENYCV